MLNLVDIHNGEHCRVLWLPGPAAQLNSLIKLAQNELLTVVENSGADGIIIKKGEKSYAMSGDIASYVRVEKEDFIPA
ncbi:MAG: hypothetical protein K5894_01625 [Lachnospiraceae bacterium]|nr:hypothetical protein [Lachnospiraceae bacterium]